MLFSMPKQEKTQANKTDNIADRQIGEPRKKTTTVTQRVWKWHSGVDIHGA